MTKFSLNEKPSLRILSLQALSKSVKDSVLVKVLKLSCVLVLSRVIVELLLDGILNPF